MEKHNQHMGHMKQISCDSSCGFMVRSHDEDEVVDLFLSHVGEKHPDMDISEEEAREKVRTV